MRFILIFAALVFSGVALSQPYTMVIEGNVAPNELTSQTYILEFRENNRAVRTPSGTSTWTADGGTITSQSSDQCVVQWRGGYRSLRCKYQASTDSYDETLQVLVKATSTDDPEPGAISITQNCGNTVVTRTYDPPDWCDCYWFWQTSRSGKSTQYGSGKSVTLAAGTQLYLQPRMKNDPTNWGHPDHNIPIATVAVNFTSPPAPSVVHEKARLGPGPIQVSVDPVAGTNEYVWYEKENDTPIPNQTGNVYKIAHLEKTTIFNVATSNGCESGRTGVAATVLPFPEILATNGGMVDFGGSMTLYLQTTYEQYVWQKDGVVIEGATASSVAVNSPGVYTVVVRYGPNQASDSFTVTRGIQGQNRNYITTYFLKRETTDVGGIGNLSIEELTQTTQYFDDFGRPSQTVTTQGSPDKHDVVQPIVYDSYGREPIKYLPYVSAERNGNYKVNPIGTSDYTTSDQFVFYNKSDNTEIAQGLPYAKTIFEPSPINRVLKQGAPGESWQPDDDNDHVIHKRYQLNDDEEVLLFTYNPITNALSVGGDGSMSQYYEANTLLINSTTDENKNEVAEYVDREGKTICKKVQSDIKNGVKVYACTYYIYDDYNKLILVLPPEAIVEILKTLPK